MATTLQNGTLLVDGVAVDWDQARVPLMSDALLRSAAVFDGLIGRRMNGSIGLIAASDHIKRLRNGVAAARMDWRWDIDEVTRWCYEAARTELGDSDQSDVYVRPMVVQADLLDAGEASSLTIAAFRRDRAQPTRVRVMTSSSRRPPHDSLSSSVKCVANYHVSRLSRLQAQSAGFDDALLLNGQGRVAEAAGAAVLVDLDGTLWTPPDWEGCLPSITIDITKRLAAELGIEFRRSPITTSDLYRADGVALVGTLSDFVVAEDVDGVQIPESPVIRRLRTAYLESSRDPNHRYHHVLRTWGTPDYERTTPVSDTAGLADNWR